jgi:protein arginine N-methyltransferase 2
MDDPAFALETDLHTQSLLLAAAHHDLSALRDLLRNTSANVQDPETGFTPLHAAIAACEPDTEDYAGANGQTNGDTAELNGNPEQSAEDVQAKKKELEEAAAQTVKLLFANGAIWNDLDSNSETPGCIAKRLGLNDVYELCVDAGVRAELLFSRLAEYQVLGDQDSEDEDEDEDEEGEVDEATLETGADATAGSVGPAAAGGNQDAGDDSTTNPTYLSAPLTISQTRILDSSANGVMMDWESTIMKRSADLLLPQQDLRVLNVGHGMGIIDSHIQSHSPRMHHIIEAHPAILSRMKEAGWYEKPNVVVHEGKWQDVVPALVEKGDMFDAIYFDTFAEEYKALREFFTEYVIGLLDPNGGEDGQGGKFGFFNGMGADRQVCYDVCTKIVEMDLFEAGFDTEWEDLPVPNLDGSGGWEGVRRKYWALDKYKLPICTFIG